MSRYGALIVLLISALVCIGGSWFCAILGLWGMFSPLLLIAVVLAVQAPRVWREARRPIP